VGQLYRAVRTRWWPIQAFRWLEWGSRTPRCAPLRSVMYLGSFLFCSCGAFRQTTFILGPFPTTGTAEWPI